MKANENKEFSPVVAEARAKISALREPDKGMDGLTLDRIIREARSFNAWQKRPVAKETLQQIHELAKWGPTSANCCPLRVVFVTSPAGKEKLLPCLAPGNVEKTRSAPVTAILGYDLRFFDEMGWLFPHKDMKPMFAENAALAETTAFRNGTLQGAYFMIAARAAGLDIGPMSGFRTPDVDKAFFSGTNIKSNFLCNLGYGSTDNLFERLPRFDFDEVCTMA